MVQSTYLALTKKPDDYPLQLAERRARSDAAERTKEYFAGQAPETIDEQTRASKFEEFFEPLFEQRKQEAGSDDWWVRLIRKIVNNQVRNLRRKFERPLKNFGPQVVSESTHNGDDPQEIEILENISERQVASTRLASAVHVPSGFEKMGQAKPGNRSR